MSLRKMIVRLDAQPWVLYVRFPRPRVGWLRLRETSWAQWQWPWKTV